MRATTLLLYLILSIMSSGLLAQKTAIQVLKKYYQKDPDTKNSGATLILYSDSTFINCSIFKDKQNQEDYVWYAYGKYEKHENQIICTSPLKNVNASKIISLIKVNYRTRIDYRMINDYFEFVYEKYNGHLFLLSDNELSDSDNQLKYTENPLLN